jgi:hypothetical protein
MTFDPLLFTMVRKALDNGIFHPSNLDTKFEVDAKYCILPKTEVFPLNIAIYPDQKYYHHFVTDDLDNQGTYPLVKEQQTIMEWNLAPTDIFLDTIGNMALSQLVIIPLPEPLYKPNLYRLSNAEYATVGFFVHRKNIARVMVINGITTYYPNPHP